MIFWFYLVYFPIINGTLWSSMYSNGLTVFMTFHHHSSWRITWYHLYWMESSINQQQQQQQLIFILYIVGVAVPAASGSCAQDKSDITGSSPAPTADPASTKFTFTFSDSRTPIATGISTNTPHALEDIVITGTGFSTTKCQNELKFGDYSCDVKTATATSVTCRIQPLNTMQVSPTPSPVSY